MNHPITLYSRWLNQVDANPDGIAVIDLINNKEMTFSELSAHVAASPVDNAPIIAEASGWDFIAKVIRAWRDGVALIPVEKNTTFDPDLLRGIPVETSHVKQTSGTTNIPRLILFNERQLGADADQIVSSMELLKYDLNIGAISMAHSYGFSNLVLPLLLYGIPLIIAESPLPEAVKKAFRHTNGKAILPGVPAMWNAWQQAGILNDAPLHLAISAGAPLTQELENDILTNSGIKIHNFYGSSECGGIAYDHSTSLRPSSNVVGRPVSGVTLSLSDDGKLIVQSPAVGIGYWPEKNSEELGNERFQTSDLAEINKITGQVTLIARAGEVINVAGRKLSPVEVENAMSQIPGIDCCVVFGVPSPDAHRVEDVVACVAMQKDITEPMLRTELHKSLPDWQLPRILWRRNDLTVNNLGKISRSDWRKRFLEERAPNRSR